MANNPFNQCNTALPTVNPSDCEKGFGRLAHYILQESDNANNAFNVVLGDITDIATWTPLLSSTTKTKITVSPVIYDPEKTSGEFVTGLSNVDNIDTLDGLSGDLQTGSFKKSDLTGANVDKLRKPSSTNFLTIYEVDANSVVRVRVLSNGGYVGMSVSPRTYGVGGTSKSGSQDGRVPFQYGLTAYEDKDYLNIQLNFEIRDLITLI